MASGKRYSGKICTGTEKGGTKLEEKKFGQGFTVRVEERKEKRARPKTVNFVHLRWAC